jgi:hypothetical protein
MRFGVWLRGLGDLAHAWIEQDGPAPAAPMRGYVDLLFSFGLARLGEADASRELLTRARGTLGGRDDVHRALCGAFEYRIKRALEGKPPTGPLPPALLEYLEHMGPMERYVVGRLRQHSYILEPDSRVDPYRHLGARINYLDRGLAELCRYGAGTAELADVHDKKEITDRVRGLLGGLGKKQKDHEDRARILKAGLNEAPRVGEDFAKELLDEAPRAYDNLPEARDQQALAEQAQFLEKALMVAAHFDRVEAIHPLVDRFLKMLWSEGGRWAVELIDFPGGCVLSNLLRLGLREEADALLTQMADLILEGRNVEDVDPKSPTWPKALRALLRVACGWYALGSDRLAEPIMEAARAVLFRDDLPYREKVLLAVNYAAAVGQAPVEVAQKRLEELFQKLTGIRDTYNTNQYYSLSQLDVIEAVVLAAVERGLSRPAG